MPSATPELPRRYVSPELVARGGMAEVYRATDRLLERVVAIKVLDDRFAADEELRQRFMREARVAAGLSGTRNVVTVFDVGETVEERPYIVMEFLPGGSVADRLPEGVTTAQALDWLEQAARGLDAAHAAGVVHRDVKPGNLMLTSEGEVQVADFGIARSPSDGALTSAGTILGTTGYMAPEQSTGGRATAASDRYALAVVAFELLTGRRPYAGETAATEALAHATAPVPRATDVDPRLPPLVDSVLAEGLAKEPAARPPSCAQLVDGLRRAFHETESETQRLPGVAAATRVERPARRPPAWVGGAGVGLLVLLAAGVGLAGLVSGDDDAPRVETVVRTETVAGEERVRTVTVVERETVEAPTTAAPDVPSSSGGASGAALNDQGYRLLVDGDVDGALPLLERAVELLAGTGELAEAYASYNLAFARFSGGSCDGVLELLDRSEEVQGKRSEINRLRKDARKECDG